VNQWKVTWNYLYSLFYKLYFSTIILLQLSDCFVENTFICKNLQSEHKIEPNYKLYVIGICPKFEIHSRKIKPGVKEYKENLSWKYCPVGFSVFVLNVIGCKGLSWSDERDDSGKLLQFFISCRADGVLGLYRGFWVSCTCIFIYRGLYFGLFDSLKPIGKPRHFL